MGLQDKVDLRRTQITQDQTRRLAVPQEQNLLNPAPSLELQSPISPRPDPREQALAAEQRRMLDAFGVKERLTEIQEKYWGCGKLSEIPGGYKLYVSFSEVGGSVDIRYDASPGYSYSTRKSSGFPEKGRDYDVSNHYVRAVPSHTEEYCKIERRVRHAIVVTADEFQHPANSSQAPQGLALFVAIGIDPGLFLQDQYNQSFHAESSETLDPKKIQKAIRQLGDGKYIPKTNDSPLSFVIENTRLEGHTQVMWSLAHRNRRREDLTSDYERLGYDQYMKAHRTDPAMVCSVLFRETSPYSDRLSDNGRDYATRPFTPWEIFSSNSSPEELDDFFAEYIVDLGLDKRTIKENRLTNESLYLGATKPKFVKDIFSFKI